MINSNNRSKFENGLMSYVGWIIKYKWLVLIASLAIVVLAASGAQYLRFDTNYRVFFSEENPQLQAFEAMQNIYTKDDNVLFVIASKSDDEVFTNQTMAAVEKLTEESWQIPYSIRVDALTNFQHTRAEEDDLIVEDLIQDALQSSSEDLANAKVIALEEPFLIKRIISENAKVTAVNVTLQFPGESINEVPETAAFAREVANKIKAEYPDLEIYISGLAMLNNAFSEASQNDMMSLTPLMFLVMFLIMFFSLRSVSGTIGTIVIIFLSMLTAMGLAGWFNTGLTPPSAQAPTIIMTLAIADSIHILVIMLREMGKGLSKYDAIKESIRINFIPVFLTSLSTVIGFLTMNFSDVPPFGHLGNITSVGVTFAFIFSITTLPAIMAILPVKRKMKVKEDKSEMIEKFSEFVIRRQNPLLYVGGAVAIFISIFVFSNELNDRFVDYFDKSIKFKTDTDFTTKNLTGIYQVQFSLGAGESGGISNPEYLANVERFANWYRQQPGVVHVNTFTDVMKRLNKSMHNDEQDYYVVPAERNLAAQYLLLYEMSLPYGLDLNNQINVDKSATRLTVTLEDVSSQEIISIGKMGEDWLEENAPEYMFAFGSSPALMFANISEINVKSMIKGSIIALLLISIMMVFALRNWKMGALSLIPNLLPAAVGFGLWGLSSGRIDIGLSVVMGMTLGIVVDDSIHFLTKYLRARREENLEPEDAVRYAFKTVGKALVVTSAILVLGFMVLSFSAFAMNGNMAKLTAITLTIALLADFLFLPPLLIKFEKYLPFVKTSGQYVKGKTAHESAK